LGEAEGAATACTWSGPGPIVDVGADADVALVGDAVVAVVDGASEVAGAVEVEVAVEVGETVEVGGADVSIAGRVALSPQPQARPAVRHKTPHHDGRTTSTSVLIGAVPTDTGQGRSSRPR
jgi:hypothetical protein